MFLFACLHLQDFAASWLRRTFGGWGALSPLPTSFEPVAAIVQKCSDRVGAASARGAAATVLSGAAKYPSSSSSLSSSGRPAAAHAYGGGDDNTETSFQKPAAASTGSYPYSNAAAAAETDLHVSVYGNLFVKYIPRLLLSRRDAATSSVSSSE